VIAGSISSGSSYIDRTSKGDQTRLGGRPTYEYRRLIRFACLDGRANEVTPLGPGAVGVDGVFIAEQFVESEPRDRGALADTAVGDRRPLAVDALLGVQFLNLVAALEGAVVVGDCCPRDILCAKDVAAALSGLL
jgi:hypothetical protein